MLTTELKYANVNHMVNLFLCGFLLFSMTTLLQLGVSGIGWQIFPRWLAKDTKQIRHNLRKKILLKLTLTNAISIDTSKTKDYYEYLLLFVYV